MRFEEFEVHGVSGGETFRLIAVHETFDNEVSALDVDLHVMSQNHDVLKEMTVMILRALFKKHRDRADERWFAMMEQAMLFRPIQ